MEDVIVARSNERNPENCITNALVEDVLARSPKAVTHRFAKEVCGIPKLGRIGPLRTQVNTFEDLKARSAVVVGISPQYGSNFGDRNISGKADPDALIPGDNVSIVLEHKIRGKCQQCQLIRHALHWALRIDRQNPLWPDGGGPPSGYHLATWGDVRSWAAREREREECDLGELERFEGLLDQRVPSSPPSERRSARPVPVFPKPEPVPIATITDRWDLERLFQATDEFVTRHPVRSHECVEDTNRMAAAFKAAGVPVLPALTCFHRDHAMSPLRSLTALFEEDDRPDIWQPAWTGWWNRTIGRGADRAVLAAMLAWGQRKSGPRRANIVANVPVVWCLAPEQSPGLEQFHEAMRVARLHPITSARP
jgi:hypothetical protein